MTALFLAIPVLATAPVKPGFSLGLAAASLSSLGILTLAILGTRSAHARARDTWVREAGLTELDVVVGVREITASLRWSAVAMTCIVNGVIAAVVLLATTGPRPHYLELWVLLGVVALGAWQGLRLVDLAHPAAEFLEALSIAMRAGINGSQDPQVLVTDLNRHRERQWGAGGAALLRALPALNRSVSSALRKYPALPEEAIRTELTSMFNELLSLAVSGAPIRPCEATTRAVRMAILGELPAGLYTKAGVRPLHDLPGWNRRPSALPGEIGRWLPHSAARAGRLAAAIITVLGVLAGIVAAMLK